MLDMKDFTDEFKITHQKDKGTNNSNYMNIYLNQSGRNSDHKSYIVPSNGAKYDQIKKK